MKLRMESTSGKWRVFIEEKPGEYKEIDPKSGGFSGINIETNHPERGFLIEFLKTADGPSNANVCGLPHGKESK